MIICIGREFGSGGHEIGKEVADRLGFIFYDRTLVEEALSRSAIPPEELERADEKKHNPWLYRIWYALVSDIGCKVSWLRVCGLPTEAVGSDNLLEQLKKVYRNVVLLILP